MDKNQELPQDLIKKLIAENVVMIFSKSHCPYCKTVKNLFNTLDVPFGLMELDEMGGSSGSDVQKALAEMTGQSTVPNIFINAQHVGGCDALLKLNAQNKLSDLLQGKPKESENAYDFDLLVLGGGSGGLASSKEAARLGMKVAVFDYIVPTPSGSTWGLGGTCVNVGCIPKKLMHQAALLGEDVVDSHHFGYSLSPNMRHNWEQLVEAVQNHIHGLNFKYKGALRSQNVKYINAYARFLDPHTVEGKDKKGKTTLYTSKYFVIATGLRPNYLNVPGAREYCITSDDLFSLPYPPGKTLCVGASYISLECAGFLRGIGYPVTVMVRSILLRGFDREMADIIGSYMERHGITFIRRAIPTKIEKLEDGTPGLYRVFYSQDDGNEIFEDFYTILLAIGREAKTDDLNLGSVGTKLNPKNKKFIVGPEDRTSICHIYAIGDNADGKPELTPVAVEAGVLLAKRLFQKAPEPFKTLCDYQNVPTTVFTPIEYGACGLAQEEAEKVYGLTEIEIWRQSFKPMEWEIAGREKDNCMFKLISVKSLGDRVVGFHYVGPHAGEVTQGFGVAMKTNKATLADFQRMISLHVPQNEIAVNPICVENGVHEEIKA